MNRKSYVLILILSGLILSALIFRNGELLLLASIFLVYLLFGVAQTPGNISLEASRDITMPGITTGESVELILTIRNQGGELKNLCLQDPLFPGMTVLEGFPNQRTALAAGETTRLNYKITASRGIYTWKTMRAVASDPLGLFEYEMEIPASGTLMVRPDPPPIRPIQLRPKATLPTAGPIAARKAGSGTDFWGIREYHAGDSLRRINWHWTARNPRKLFTNEFEREEIADYGLILDARRLTSSEEVENAIFEHSVNAAAALGKNFLRNGNRVSLLVYGKHVRTAFPGYGKHQRDKLLRQLAGAKLSEEFPFTSIDSFPTKLFPARSFLVIFSIYDDRDRLTYAQLRSHGYSVLLISPDPIDFTAGILPDTKVNSLAARAARIERVFHFNCLLKLGINVIDWQVDEPLEPLIRKTSSWRNTGRINREIT
ncbi:MAG: DUF58 domain-containing protein [Anaerolineales bacterium]|nr:DUF58 domain-containing protein [Anaerolineales bacterium]